MNSKPLSKSSLVLRSSIKFKTPKISSFTSENQHLMIEDNSWDEEIDRNYFDMFRGILKNKRETKELRKIHEELFENYVLTLGYVSMKTAKRYCKIISKFLLYSPSVDPDELEPFIIEEFGLKKMSGTIKEGLKGTPLKYYRCINTFLKSLYSTEYSTLSPQYAESIKSGFKNNETTASLSDVLNAYYALTKIGKFEDALILHLMYSLGSNLEILSLLTYGSIDDKNNIKFFDTQKMEYVDAKLNEHLVRDIFHFKDT